MAQPNIFAVVLGAVGGLGGFAGLQQLWKFLAVDKPQAALAETARLWERVDAQQARIDELGDKVRDCERREAQWELRYERQTLDLDRLRAELDRLNGASP